MRAYVWTYKVKPDRIVEFRRGYSSTGDWARLFATSPDYRGPKLLCDAIDKSRFMTIDYFSTPDGRGKFLASNKARYDALDEIWQDATIEESCVGEFDIEGEF